MSENKSGFFGKRWARLRNKTGKVVGAQGILEGRDAILGMGEHLAELRRGGKRKAREETFGHAYRRLGLDENQLAQNHKYQIGRFYLFGLFFALSFGFLLYAIMRGTLISIGPSLGATLLFGSLAFQASFRLLQIERRELIPVNEWVRSPGSWIPGPFVPRADSAARTQGRQVARRPS